MYLPTPIAILPRFYLLPFDDSPTYVAKEPFSNAE